MKTKIKTPAAINIYLPVILTVFVIIALSATFLRSKLQDIITINTSIKESKERLEKLTKKINKLQKLDFDSLKEKNTTLKDTLPATKNIPQLLNSLETMAAQTKINLALIKVNPGEISTPSAAAESKIIKNFKDSYEVEVTAQGNYSDLIKFLEKTNYTSPIITIEKISFSLRDKKETDKAFVQINLLAYFYPEIKTIGKISDSLPQISSHQEKNFKQLAKFKTYNTLVESIPTGKKNPFVLAE